MNTNKSATRSVNRKLLAALAVLAVALVALAAIPAVADSSDAATEANPAPTQPTNVVKWSEIGSSGTGYTYSSGALSVSKNLTITVDKLITSSLAISKTTGTSGDVTVYLVLGTNGTTTTETGHSGNGLMQGTSSAAIALTVNSGIDLVVFDGRSSTGASNPAIQFVDMTINGADVWFEKGVLTTFNGGSLTMVGGTLVNHANGIIVDDHDVSSADDAKGLTMTSGAKIIVENSQYHTYKSTTKLNALSILTINSPSSVGKGCSISMAEGANLTLNKRTTANTGNVSKIDIQGTVDANVFIFWNAPDNGLTVSNGGSLTGKIGLTGDAAFEGTVSSTDSTGITLNAASTDGGDTRAFAMAGTGSMDGNLTWDLSVNGTMSIPAGKTVSLNRGESLVTGTDGSISLGVGAKLVLDADQRQPVMFTAIGESVVTSTVSSGAYTLAQKSGNLELTTGSYNVDNGFSMTLEKGTFTIGKKAAVKVNNAGSNTGEITINSGATFVNSGVLAYMSIPTSKPTNMSDAVYRSIVQAYAISKSTTAVSTQVSDLTFDDMGYAGEIIDVTATVDRHYKISQVGYGVESTSFSMKGNATDNEDYVVDSTTFATTGTWTFKMPAYAVALGATAVGAYTVSYVAVSENGKTLATYSAPSTYADVDQVYAPTVSVDGYAFAGWYEETSLLNSAGTLTGNTLALNDELDSSITLYAKMLVMYKITYADGINGTIAGPTQALPGTTVSVSASADDGYRYAEGSVKVSSASGSVTSKKTTGGATFTMPAADVTVTATFDELYDFTVPAKYVYVSGTNTNYTQANPDVSIDIQKYTGTGASATLSTVASNYETTGSTTVGKAAIVQYIAGEDVYVKVTITTANTGIIKIALLDKNGKDLGVTVTETDTDGVYTFEMPGQAATLSVTYGPQYEVTYNSPDETDGIMYVVDGSGATVETGDFVAQTSTVTVTATAVNGKVLKSVTVKGTASPNTEVKVFLEDGIYSFSMPGFAVTITVEFADAVSVKQVLIASTVNGGSVDYKASDLTTYAGGTVSFSVELKDGYALAYKNGIVAKMTGSTTYSTASNGYITIGTTAIGSLAASTSYSLSYPAASVDGVTIAGSLFAYDAEANVVTLTMPGEDIESVTFAFVQITYKTIIINSENGTVGLYSDEECTEEYTDADASTAGIQIPTGSKVYVLMTAGDGVQIGGINATYRGVVSGEGTSTSPYVYGDKAVALTVVSAPEANDLVKAIYSFQLDNDTTINATFAKTALQQAKDEATEYIQGIQKSASMSETIIGGDATWAAQADADEKIFSDALSKVAAASNAAAVSDIRTQFDADLLAYLKTTSVSYLDAAYNNGNAVDGKVMSSEVYTTAITTINAVVLDDDKTVQDEVDAVVAAYDAAMNARTSVTPTPEPGTYAASIDAALSANGLNLMVVSSDDGKLIQKGTVTIAVTYSYTAYDALLGKTVQDTDTFTFTYTLSADSGYAYIPVDYSGIDSSRTVVGASAAVSIDSLSATTAVQGFTLA